MLVDHPLADYASFAPDEVRALAELDLHTALALLGVAYTPEQSYALTLATHLDPDRLERLLAVCELTTLPGLSADEARVLTFVGFGSLRRLANAHLTELGAAQAVAHRATLSRWGLDLLTEARLSELRDQARHHPAVRHLPWDMHQHAGRRWHSNPLPEATLLPLLRHGDRAVVAGVAAEMRQELHAVLLHALDGPVPPDLVATRRLGYYGTALALAAHTPDRQAQRETIARQLRQLTRRWPNLAEPHRSQGLLEGWCAAAARANEALTTLSTATLALAHDLQAALVAESTLEAALLTLGARLERLLGRLSAVPYSLSPWEIAPLLAPEADLTAYAEASYRGSAQRLALEALLLALATLQPTLVAALHVATPLQAAAATLPPATHLPGVGQPVAAVLATPPQGAVEVTVTGDLVAVWQPQARTWELRLYGYPAATFLVVTGLPDSITTHYAYPFQTTPVTLWGTLEAAARTLTVLPAPPAVTTWPHALLAQAQASVPLFTGVGAVWTPRTLLTLQAELLPGRKAP